MELDDLKSAWSRLGVDGEADPPRSPGVDRHRKRTGLEGLRISLLIELALNVAGMFPIGWFLGRHSDELVPFVAAVMLQLACVASIVGGARQLVELARVDPCASVVETQRAVALLRGTRLFVIRWTLILAPLLWTPLSIVAARGLLGIDMLRLFGAGWIAANLGFGILVLVAALAINAWGGDRLGNSAWIGRVGDHLAGRSLADAARRLEAIAAFRNEAGAGPP